jgi:uncharacterized protein YjiS (DUF1127 family)
MLLVDVAADRSVQSPIARVFRGLARSVADARAKRERKTALQDLLFASEHRLRDLGISREELIQAMERHR